MTVGAASRSIVPYRVAVNTLGAEEIDAAKAMLDSGRFTLGEHVRAFEPPSRSGPARRTR
ncbi:MAG TPA: hypothetical protein VGI70_15760 [Polyangiales bacterium]|jgi:dTDP-4-amino-4,6-dideoxygalactose transaminase